MGDHGSKRVGVTLRLKPRPWAGCSCSGFRPTGVLEGATGLPVGLHKAGALLAFPANLR